jgi:hypothetical protein
MSEWYVQHSESYWVIDRVNESKAVRKKSSSWRKQKEIIASWSYPAAGKPLSKRQHVTTSHEMAQKWRFSGHAVHDFVLRDKVTRWLFNSLQQRIKIEDSAGHIWQPAAARQGRWFTQKTTQSNATTFSTHRLQMRTWSFSGVRKPRNNFKPQLAI